MDIVPAGYIDDPCAYGRSLFQYLLLVVIGPVIPTLDICQNLHTAQSSSLMTSLVTELRT
jgi:hypothetical protein